MKSTVTRYLIPTLISLVYLQLGIVRLTEVTENVTENLKDLYNITSKLKAAPVPPISIDDGPLLVKLDVQYAFCGIFGIDIRELTIAKVHELFNSGKLTSVALTRCYLQRIRVMNPYLHSVIQISETALPQALGKDKDRLFGKARGALHGIPILINDDIATFDATQTTSGSLALENICLLRDALVIKYLRNAGAIILGKASVSEFGNFRDPLIPESWSGRGGQGRNPYILSSYPSSDTGPSAAVAANLCMAAVGTQTTIGITRPSSQCAVVGLKPTLNFVSTDGLIPLSPSQDVIGPIARTTMDTALMMSVMASNELDGCVNVRHCLNQKSFRIGVPRNEPYWNATADPIIRLNIGILNVALAIFNSTGKVRVVDPVLDKTGLLHNITATSREIVIAHEFKVGIKNWLENAYHFERILGRNIKNLADIIAFNEKHPEGYGQAKLILSEGTDGLLNSTYQSLRDLNHNSAQQYIVDMINNYNLDALAAPCYATAGLLLSEIAAIGGLPTISIPAGNLNGQPVGICLTGRAQSETVLLKLSYYLEQQEHFRTMPTFRN